MKQTPEVPTLTELEYQYFEPYGLFGFLTPVHTPQPIVDMLGRAISEIVKRPDVTASIEKMGLQAIADGPIAFGDVIESDLHIWSKVITDAKIKVE